MGTHVLAYDFGTGGSKASLYNEKGECLADCFEAYETYYPASGWHEQRPNEWWEAVVKSTRKLLVISGIDSSEITAIGLSGHSLAMVPVSKSGELLIDAIPIWSDSRADKESTDFFTRFDEKTWYEITGAGFPPHLYTVFEIMWLKENKPEVFAKVDKILGSKDYINFKMTGKMLTDFSYASGTGVYDLKSWNYSEELIKASNLPASIFPEIVPSTEIIGTLTAEAAIELGLPQSVKVVAGGVDNSCMALGAGNIKDGRVYNSMGSSSWIAVTSTEPLINAKTRPYVFTHVLPGLFNSATAIFSAGSSFRWVRDELCRDLKIQSEQTGKSIWELMISEALQSPAGAKGLIFNPTLAGGSYLDKSSDVRGAFLGIDLLHKREDLVRASMEGIAFGLRHALDELKKLANFDNKMTIVGGGAKDPNWCQIYADVYDMTLIKTAIDQQAAALGAAALALYGSGIWQDFDRIDELHQIERENVPNPESVVFYEQILPKYLKASTYLSELASK